MGTMRKSGPGGYKQDRLMAHFVFGTTARTAARPCGVNRKTAVYYYRRLRGIVVLELEAGSGGLFGGGIEVDGSYFGGRRKGRRGRGAAGKVPVSGC